jgi:hypothetical protein
MTRHPYLFASLGAAMLVGNVAGCADDSGDSTIIILESKLPDADCKVTPSLDGIALTQGVINATMPRPFLAFPLMQNVAMSGTSAPASVRTFFASKMSIVLTSPDPVTSAALSPATFSTPVAFTLAPDGSFAVTGVNVMSQQQVADIGATLSGTRTSTLVNASIAVEGKMGGGSISSNTFDFPIEVCIGAGCIDNYRGGCQ